MGQESTDMIRDLKDLSWQEDSFVRLNMDVVTGAKKASRRSALVRYRCSAYVMVWEGDPRVSHDCCPDEILEEDLLEWIVRALFGGDVRKVSGIGLSFRGTSFSSLRVICGCRCGFCCLIDRYPGRIFGPKIR